MRTLFSVPFVPSRLFRTRRAWTLTPVLLGIAAVSALPGASMPRAAEETYTLQPVFKAGDTDRYNLTFQAVVNGTQTQGQDQDFSLTMLLKETTQEVKADGTATQTIQPEQATAGSGTQEMNALSMVPRLTQTRDKQGKVTELKPVGTDTTAKKQIGAILQQILQTETKFTPPKPVKVGETWSVEPPVQKAEGSDIKSNGKAELVGKETVAGVETVKIKFVEDVTVTGKETRTGHFEGTGNLSVKDGKIVRLIGKIETSSPMLKEKWDFTLTRVLGS